MKKIFFFMRFIVVFGFLNVLAVTNTSDTIKIINKSKKIKRKFKIDGFWGNSYEKHPLVKPVWLDKRGSKIISIKKRYTFSRKKYGRPKGIIVYFWSDEKKDWCQLNDYDQPYEGVSYFITEDADYYNC